MLFNSPLFIVFYVLVLGSYWALRSRGRQNVFLLAASYVFYGAWSWKLLPLMIASTLFDYVMGRLVQAASDERRKRNLTILSAVANLALLGVFKYLGFLVTEAADLLRALGFSPHLSTLQIVLPIGISFYTFQKMGYVVDVYRGKIQAERNVVDFSLFITFFPQLVAGPIERATNLLPQLKHERRWDWPAFESGLQLMAWGLFKKIVVADNLAPYVNAVYAQPGQYAGTTVVTAMVFFAFQIYCDFSGYTDTARGVSRTLGINLSRNFDFPYISRSPIEFWKRWHISLSQWFQDYLYFPLAMRYLRQGGWGSKYKAHIISMTLIGLWHGANWTFVVFGFYWGVVIALYLYAMERLSDLDMGSRAARWFAVDSAVRRGIATAAMFAVVCLGWVLFRAPSLTQAGEMLARIGSREGFSQLARMDILPAWLLWGLIVALLAMEWFYRNSSWAVRMVAGSDLRRMLSRYALVVVVLVSYLAAQRGQVQPFIYFQF
jgi:D-alanyl-lipoteichoic acid acyltransferase DltB (MBOAT superfamily)